MNGLIKNVFTYTKLKMIIAMVLLVLSIIVYNMSAYTTKADTISAIENYINVVKNDFTDREYRNIKAGRNMDAMMRLTSQHGNLKTYGNKYMVMSFNNRGDRYHLSFYKNGGEKRLGLKISDLAYDVEDIFINDGYNIRIKTVDCESTAFFSASKLCIDKTYKIY